MAALAVVLQDCRARGVNLKRNLIQTSLGRRQRGFYVLFCVLYVPCFLCYQSTEFMSVGRFELVPSRLATSSRDKNEARLLTTATNVHCKKSFSGFLNYSRPGRVWLVTSRLGTGKPLTLFYSV
jgi:hypothetical protein